MKLRCSAVMALGFGAFLASSAPASAAGPNAADYVGKRLVVGVQQLLFYEDPSKSYIGSLQRGASFRVSRLSATGTYAFGFAYGSLNRAGWVTTSGLDKPAAADSANAPKLVGTPSLRYTYVEDGNSRYLSIGAVFRTDRALDRSTYATIAAPNLTVGQKLPDALFGGVTLGTIGRRSRHCYVAEVSQLTRRSTLGDKTWKFALRRSSNVTGTITSVKLKAAGTANFELSAAARLGC